MLAHFAKGIARAAGSAGAPHAARGALVPGVRSYHEKVCIGFDGVGSDLFLEVVLRIFGDFGPTFSSIFGFGDHCLDLHENSLVFQC